MAYNDADWQMEGIGHEEDLSAYRWEESWADPCGGAGCAHDIAANRFVLQLDHMSEFVLGARYPAFLPLVIRE